MLEDRVIQAKLHFSIIRSCEIEKNILILSEAARRQDYMEYEHTGEVRYIYVKNNWRGKFNKMTKQVSEASTRPVIVLDSKDAYEESGPVIRNRFNHVTEYTMGSRSQLKTELKKEGQQGKCNELHEENLQDFGVSKASSDYRKRVLNVPKKHRKAYPDLNKKLTRNRYKRLARITILRGFFVGFRMRCMMKHSNHGRTLAV